MDESTAKVKKLSDNKMRAIVAGFEQFPGSVEIQTKAIDNLDDKTEKTKNKKSENKL